jgi:hypothetical protein
MRIRLPRTLLKFLFSKKGLVISLKPPELNLNWEPFPATRIEPLRPLSAKLACLESQHLKTAPALATLEILKRVIWRPLRLAAIFPVRFQRHSLRVKLDLRTIPKRGR